ncbi:MAG: carboxypeptidase M32 [Phycisphaerae bacterium]|jgi:carboxypeptidase Taq
MSGEKYASFAQRIREYHAICSAQGVLEWDQMTMMPAQGAPWRAEQIAAIAGLAHEKLTDPALGEELATLTNEAEAGGPEAATNVREMRRLYERAVRLPKPLVQELARTTSVATDVWQAARADADFPRFAPHLERLLELKREVAERIGWKTEMYDALMDEFEPGARAADVQRLFDALRDELVPLAAALAEAPRQPKLSLLKRTAPVAGQAAFNRVVAEAMGFDFAAGRMDISTHPFCTGFWPRDVRITTRYDEQAVGQSLFGVMHETGHALYEQGLNPEHAGTPMGQHVSLGIHESQSRLWENQVGRSRAFWQHWFPRFQHQFPAFADVAVDDWYFAINAVRPSLIRVEADEVTYGLHIMLRFDLERQMLDGRLAVKDLPEAWSEGIRKLLSVTPNDDAEGCLQDIHWSLGTFGYFPTYQLGNLYAAQFFAAARRALPDLDQQLARGELLSLREWLQENIHRHGQRYRAGELVERVTGQPLSHGPFMAYLKAKLCPLYGL